MSKAKKPLPWLEEWKSDVKQLEFQVKNIKSKLSKPFQNYTCLGNVHTCENDMSCRHPGYDQEQLSILKLKLTCLYQYRRASFGKIHTAKLPRNCLWFDQTSLIKKYEDLKVVDKQSKSIK